MQFHQSALRSVALRISRIGFVADAPSLAGGGTGLGTLPCFLARLAGLLPTASVQFFPGKAVARNPPTSDHPPRIRVGGSRRSTPHEGRQTCPRTRKLKMRAKPIFTQENPRTAASRKPLSTNDLRLIPASILNLRNANNPSGQTHLKAI